MMSNTNSSNALVDIQNLSFSYPGGKQALNDVSLQLHAGQFHALLGLNGAGKSTLFSLVSRLFRLQQGDILLNGTSLKAAPAKVLGAIGLVFQQSTLDLDLSVSENLNYHASLHGMGRAIRNQRIDEELARLEINDVRNKKVRALNGGHRRRVEIARALLHQPSLLLLDEATVGLDPATRQGINQHVRSLCQQRNVAVLWATHLIEEIQPGDTVALLHKSQLLACDSMTAICQQAGQTTLVDAFATLTGTEART